MTTDDFKYQAETLRPRLLSVARHYLSGADDAEDVVQEVMLKLWLIRGELILPVDGLATTMTRNLCIDLLRRRQPTIDIASLPEEEVPDDDGGQIEQMLLIIDQLPSAQRTILRMRHLEGMEMKEIATVLGSTEVAVRKSLSRARMAVRRKLIAWMAAACLVIGLSAVTVRWLTAERDEEECVAYVYGRKCTDEQTVIQEMRRTMGEAVEQTPREEIEQQLNELFNE